MDFRPRGKKDNSKRRGVPAQIRDQKRLEATARQTSYDKLTVKEKIEKLDRGGYAAKKQRTKLLLPS